MLEHSPHTKFICNDTNWHIACMSSAVLRLPTSALHKEQAASKLIYKTALTHITLNPMCAHVLRIMQQQI